MATRQKRRESLSLEEVTLKTALSPRLSIILCTYNRRNLVLSTLASLRRQTLPYSQFEIIVIDNGSSDGTLEAVRSYVNAGSQQTKKQEDIWKVQCLSEPQNGLAYARNTGLLAASGEIAVFLDDDTLAEPHYLERLLAAYEETGADAIGGRVEIRMEAVRPHWLTEDLLEYLGKFAPSPERIKLDEEVSFSSSSFSVKIEALRSIGFFSPFLSKRLYLPASMEVHNLCHRLHKAGYSLWCEPSALVLHRATSARLIRPFFVGRAYWQGRSEMLSLYMDTFHEGDAALRFSTAVLRAILVEVRMILFLALIHRPLLYLAGKSTNERLQAAMAQARSWGHVEQRLQFLEHVPAGVAAPAVLLVRPKGPDATADLLARALAQQDVSCTVSEIEIPLAWLWRHRTRKGRFVGILHFYHPGAFDLTHQQRQKLWFRLWLARRWGISIVTSDTGGWWQSTHNLRFLARRSLERRLMRQSQIVLGYTRQPEQLYPEKKLRRKVRSLPHPGFLGYYKSPLARKDAHQQLGIPGQPEDTFVYLCLADEHTERELIYLIETFNEMCQKLKPSEEDETQKHPVAQLLLVGTPIDKALSMRIFQLAALNSAIHLHTTAISEEDMPLYMGAIDAIVLPHFSNPMAGLLETALLALSFGHRVVAPNLPRFRGMLPPHASTLYKAGSKESLLQALLRAQKLDAHLNEREQAALEAEAGWGQYAHRLLKIYKQLLQ